MYIYNIYYIYIIGYGSDYDDKILWLLTMVMMKVMDLMSISERSSFCDIYNAHLDRVWFVKPEYRIGLSSADFLY